MLLDKETSKKRKKFSSLLSLSSEFDLITVIKGKRCFHLSSYVAFWTPAANI